MCPWPGSWRRQNRWEGVMSLCPCLARLASHRVHRSALALGILIEITAEDVGNNKHDDQQGEINNLTANAVESAQAQGHMGSWALARFSFSLDLCPRTVSLSSLASRPAGTLLSGPSSAPGFSTCPPSSPAPWSAAQRGWGSSSARGPQAAPYCGPAAAWGEAGGAGLGRVVPGGRVLTLAWGPQASPSV